MNKFQKGFSAVELLATLFIASIFITAGYQLLLLSINDNANTLDRAAVNKVAKSYVEIYKQYATTPCVNGTIVNKSITITGVPDASLSITMSCPNTELTNLAKISATVSFGDDDSVSSTTFQEVTSLNCPSGFITVPGSPTYGTSNFCVMKYEAKIQGNDVGDQTYNSAFVPESRMAGTPWVNISQTNAIAEAQTVCEGCHLITEAEWMTLAQNIASVAENWSSGVVGSGYLYSGHHDSSPNNPLAASTDDDSFSGTGNSTPSNQKRTLILTNGEVIWDLSGNVIELTSSTTNNQPGIIGETIYQSKDWNAVDTLGSLTIDPTPAGTEIEGASAWTNSVNNIGVLYSNTNDTSTKLLMRSGNWTDTNAAIFLLMTYLDDGPYSGTGFRVAR